MGKIMPNSQLRSEGVRLRPFMGVREVQDSLEKNVALEISTAEKSFRIQHKDKLSAPPEEMKVAGLALEISDISAVVKTVTPLVLSHQDIDYLVVAVDGSLSPLRTLEVLARGPLDSLDRRIEINSRGSKSSSLVLSNSNGPYKLELALVHNKNLTSSSGLKPRALGALLGKVEFVIRPIGVDDHPKPKPMTSELKIALGLPKSAWIYFEFSDSLLTSEVFDESIAMYVDEELLDLLMIANPISRAPIEAAIVSNFVHALCFETKTRLQEGISEELVEQLSGSAVFRLIKKHFGKDSIQELLEKIISSPGLVATQILSSAVLLDGLKAVMEVQDND